MFYLLPCGCHLSAELCGLWYPSMCDLRSAVFRRELAVMVILVRFLCLYLVLYFLDILVVSYISDFFAILCFLLVC